MGTIEIDGATPKLTIGNATAEDATILFDGAAQDFYIALDDSADDLLIGLGSTVGTTPIISMDENKKVSLAADLDVTTVATAATFEPDGDTSSGDNAAIGYTSGEGLILTGQGSTSDITLKNDADGTVFTVPTGTDDILFPDSAKAMLGAASDMTLYHDGSNSYITNKTGALKVATETSGIAITIGHTTSETTIADNLTITGTTVGTSFDLNGTADGLILDANGNTTISSPTDDQIDIEIAGADDFKFTANEFTALSGSDIVHADTGSVRNRPNALPIVINGDMEISQRSTSVTGIGDGDAGFHCLDRFNFAEGQSPSAVWTMTQETLTADEAWQDGFTKALKMDVTTSDDVSGHGDILNTIVATFEKDSVKCFKKGTSGAETYTLAFWIKATKTGTHIVELDDRTNDRGCSKAFTVSSSDTWEHKVVNFPKDTSGPIGTGNARGFRIIWPLMHGGNYGSSSLQTTWGSSNTSARYTGQVNNADSTSNNWHLTGVQLEVGTYDSDSIPPFQHESRADNLRRCQRYFYKPTSKYSNCGKSYSMTNLDMELTATVDFPTRMRADPTFTAGTNNFRDNSDNSLTPNVSHLSTDGHGYGMKDTGGGNQEFGILFYGQTYAAEMTV